MQLSRKAGGMVEPPEWDLLITSAWGLASNMAPQSNVVIPNFMTGTDQQVAKQSILHQPIPRCRLEVIPNSTAELTNQSLNAV